MIGSFAILMVCLSTCFAVCPQKCNSRGNCNLNNQCECWSGFRGAACGEYVCPIGVPWFETAALTDTAHRPLTATECSTMGTCNRLNGKCACYSGFEGIACEILSCPNNCNQHGRCTLLSDSATGDDDLNLHVTTTYSYWDADRIYGCLCDEGFAGYDCSLRTCVKGQDPRLTYTTLMVDETQTFACTASSGSFKFLFRGETTDTIAYSSTASQLTALLEALDTIDDVTVTVSNSAGPICDADEANFVVTFTRQHGDVPALGIEQVTGVTLALSSSVTGTKDDEVCNNRGLCSETTGLCTCYGGFSSSDGTGRTSASSAGTTGTMGDCGFESSTPTGCPGSTPCTDQGTCSGSPDFTCTCFDGYMSGDCSLRSCPYGRAWWDEPSAANVAHASAECSNRGVCDRSNGKCTCLNGFTGEACQRIGCPSSGEDSLPCAGKGRCVSMREMASRRYVNGILSSVTYGTVRGGMTPWDADKIYGCMCDGRPYLEGGSDSNSTDCASRDCPRGDDITTKQQDETQTIFCSATGGSFTLEFRGETTDAILYNTHSMGEWKALGTATVTQYSTAISSTSSDFSSTLNAGDIINLYSNSGTDTRNYTVASDSSSTVTMTEAIGMSSETGILVRYVTPSVKTALEKLTSIGSVNVSFSTGTTACSSSGTYIHIGFLSNYGDLPLMTATNSLTGGSDSVVVMETRKGKKENEECSMHGECNRDVGLCKCFDGWRSSNGQGTKGVRGDCGARDWRASGDFT